MKFQSAIIFKLFFFVAFFALAMARPYGNPPSNNSPHQNTPPPPSPPSNKSPYQKSPPPPPPPAHKPAPSKVATTAKPTPTKAPAQCNTGPIQCCNSVQPAKSMSGILDLLGIAVDDLTTNIGMNCSPLSAVGLSAGECNASPVCCEGNSFGGLVSVGCSPISI